MNRTENFITRNSRPLDFLLWLHSRGHSRRQEVLEALAAYQNEDGGFAWGIEPDNLNEFSTPMGTWKATTSLRQIDCFDREVPLVEAAVGYLLRVRRPDGHWSATDPTTNGFPHAEWWEDTGPEGRVWGINPTAAVLGYLLRAGLELAADVQQLVHRYVAGGR